MPGLVCFSRLGRPRSRRPARTSLQYAYTVSRTRPLDALSYGSTDIRDGAHGARDRISNGRFRVYTEFFSTELFGALVGAVAFLIAFIGIYFVTR
jgi:hypothetical protein